jgi:6-phosphogluconate dehydrogenase
LVLNHRKATVDILKAAMDNSVAVPALGSALNYVDMFGTGRSGSNLIQAQRDYFGAHTYERIDKPGENFHTNWI